MPLLGLSVKKVDNIDHYTLKLHMHVIYSA